MDSQFGESIFYSFIKLLLYRFFEKLIYLQLIYIRIDHY